MIKEELSNEEKFLESVIKLEKFYKKYKKPIIALGIAIVVGGIGYWGYSWKRDYDLRIANEAYDQLLSNPDKKDALETLKEKNPKLYHLYLYQRAIANKDIKTLDELAKSEDPILSDLATYHIDVIKKDADGLQHYTLNSAALLRGYAILDRAFLLMKNGKIAQARKELGAIKKESPAYPYAMLLRHYGAKGRG